MGFSNNLRYKLLLQVLIVTILLLLGYTLVWLAITREQIIATSSTQVASTARQANSLVEKYISARLLAIQTYAEVKTETTQGVKTLINADEHITAVTIISEDGEEVAFASKGTIQKSNLQNHKESPEYKVANFMGGQRYIGEVYQQNGSNFVNIALPANPSGVVVATLQLDPLVKELQSLSADIKGSVKLDYKKATKLSENAQNVYQDKNENGKDVLAFHTVNALTGWNILVQVPIENILQPLSGIYGYAVLLFVAAAIFAVLLALTLSNGTVTAFRNLKAGFDNFTKGNLAFRVPVSGQGEIEEISKALNGMIGQIHLAYLKVDQQRQAVEIDKAKTLREFSDERERMKKTLSDDREKVNFGLFVEKEKVNAIMGNITDSVILLNKNREILFFNKVAEDLLGHPSQEMQHKLITAAMKVFEKDTEIPWDEYAPFQNQNAGVVFKKDKVRIENSTISPRFAKMLTVKANFHQSDDLGFIIILHNLNQEMELEKTEMRFVGTVINELKAPVSIILQCLPFLKQNAVDESQRMYTTGVQTGVDQITLLMQNFLLAMQIEEHKIQPNIQPIDITEVIREVCDVMSPQVQMKFITFNYQQPDEPVSKVSADPANVRDILLNFLGNAIKFTPAHGGITIAVRQLADEVLVEVQDTGMGIPKEHIPNLFKKFYTVPDPKVPDLIGTGLGLFIARSLAELNHGKVWADSVEDKGSTFGFALKKAA